MPLRQRKLPYPQLSVAMRDKLYRLDCATSAAAAAATAAATHTVAAAAAAIVLARAGW